jgi:hypothetical protein
LADNVIPGKHGQHGVVRQTLEPSVVVGEDLRGAKGGVVERNVADLTVKAIGGVSTVLAELWVVGTVNQ